MKILIALACLFLLACSNQQSKFETRISINNSKITTENQSKISESLISQIDSLIYISGDPLDCSALTWRIVAAKQNAIPLLINKLDDTRMTANDQYCVGDIALLVLSRIMELPYFAVTGIQCCTLDCDLLSDLRSNRAKVKEQINDFYFSNRANLKWEKIDESILDPCEKEHQILERYSLSY